MELIIRELCSKESICGIDSKPRDGMDLSIGVSGSLYKPQLFTSTYVRYQRMFFFGPWHRGEEQSQTSQPCKKHAWQRAELAY